MDSALLSSGWPEDIQGRYGLRVTLEDDQQDLPLDPQVSVTLFRTARELLINVARHAQVGRSAMRLSSDDGRLHIIVGDEGIGFDSSAVGPGHFGLFSIRERLRHLGGAMEIRSSPGRGTTVMISAPFARRGDS